MQLCTYILLHEWRIYNKIQFYTITYMNPNAIASKSIAFLVEFVCWWPHFLKNQWNLLLLIFYYHVIKCDFHQIQALTFWEIQLSFVTNSNVPIVRSSQYKRRCGNIFKHQWVIFSVAVFALLSAFSALLL